MKQCNKCDQSKPLEMFYAHATAADGRRGDCKACNNEYARKRLSDPDKRKARKEYSSSWIRENRERIARKSRERYASSPEERERIRVANEKWRSENPDRASQRYRESSEKIKSASAKRYSANKSECLAAAKIWRNNNPDKIRTYSRARKSKVRAAEGTWNAADIKTMMNRQLGVCVYCQADIADSYHVDHVMPIYLGGSNWPRNLQLLCPTCNRRKGRKHPDDFEREIGFIR